MQHVTDKLHLWLSGELTDAEATAVSDHLAECPACAAAAEQERELWRALGAATGVDDAGSAAEPIAARDEISVWPAVRARTVARKSVTAWFGQRPALGMTLAAGAMAAGLVLSVLAPLGVQQATDKTGGSTGFASTNESLWLSDGSWLSGSDTDGLDLVWLTAGSDETKDDS